MPVFKYAALCFAASLVHGKAESSSGTGIRGTEERELQGRPVCEDPGLKWNAMTEAVLKSTANSEVLLPAMVLYRDEGYTVGSITDMLAEAADASATDAPVENGKSGDTDFPFANVKVLATMGERNACNGPYKGNKLNGVPDGVGAYLYDDATIRLVYQSESYGPLRYDTAPYPVNDGAAKFGGSYVHYIDYDRSLMADFMTNKDPASSMVTHVGTLIETVYNLKGELVGPRNGTSPTPVGAHYGNTDADGLWTVAKTPTLDYDWFYQSFCSAHLEPPFQWGPGTGMRDHIFLTNEEWMNYLPGSNYVGLGAHALDLKKKTMWAVGVFGQGGFEKLVELNPQHNDFVIIAPSGYNGDFTAYDRDGGNVTDEEVQAVPLKERNKKYTRSDGKDYVWPQNIVPHRIYIGVKGKMEDGSDAPKDDFLARNGLRYGKTYSFAIDMSKNGPTKGMWRDEFHRDPKMAYNGAQVDGKFVADKWEWDGEVKNFAHDIAWDFQDSVPGMGDHIKYWTGMGPDEPGCKCEHNTPDPSPGTTAVVWGCTCGYFGKYYIHGVEKALKKAAKSGKLPKFLDSTYYVYQGDLDVTKQIELGGKGQYPDGLDAKMNYNNIDEPMAGEVTLQDNDGMELIQASDGQYIIIQEDAGNIYGERMFIAKLEHEDDGKELKYYLLALGRGKMNTRTLANVGIPKDVVCKPDANEFSGIYDLSGYLHKDDDDFTCSAKDDGSCKRMADAMIKMNDKQFSINLQAHESYCGILEAFVADRGGQIYMFQTDLP